MVYDLALFAHMLGVVLLAFAVSFSAGAHFGARRATNVGQLRSALAHMPAVQRIMPIAILLILVPGLYMVSRHGGDGAIKWNSGWVVVSFVQFVIIAVLGAAVEGQRLGKLRTAAQAAPDGPISAELDAARRDPAIHFVMFFGFGMITSFLFLMTVKPEKVLAAIAVPVVATVIAVGLSRIILRDRAVAEPAART